MDLTESIAPRSDQLNAEDLLTGPRAFTIEKVNEGSAEQPVNVHLVEFPGRPYRPSKTCRRLMVAAWGKDSSAYAGRRLTLYRDPEITFGRDKVGGIRISHMSHIDKRLTLALTVTRGKRAAYIVDPMPNAPEKRNFLAEAALSNGDVGLLRALWNAAQAAQEPKTVLDAIFALATPAKTETPAPAPQPEPAPEPPVDKVTGEITNDDDAAWLAGTETK